MERVIYFKIYYLNNNIQNKHIVTSNLRLSMNLMFIKTIRVRNMIIRFTFTNVRVKGQIIITGEPIDNYKYYLQKPNSNIIEKICENSLTFIV